MSSVDEGKLFCTHTAHKYRRNYRIRKITILQPLKNNNFRQWSSMSHKTIDGKSMETFAMKGTGCQHLTPEL